MKDINNRISQTLKSLRNERNWSLDKAAEKTGVSKAMLGQIERGESSPTIATLWKIASGFQTSFSSFIEDCPPHIQEPIHRAGVAQHLHPSDKKIRVMPLFPFDKQLNFELFVIELLASCEHLSPPHATGVIEHVIVIQGTIEVFVNNVWHPLNKGEGFRFNANQVHGYRNMGKKTACIHDIIHYPNS
ncbi:XRE family transcriptional regulator [Candidatus Berkiella cookevillensis]|uniref:XRE family transcriptional regulator n=1 Tax=Candidatus Berkiella cookevillensis TaxID=437022 RepID=A0AAE3HRR3_9GAMM|nr:XRE family transcriptional regulator [Candidatus Berkiella cookevillensis]MCS5708696.1 XRE family transcriptional regulator [Candidatus Berkiella cookevillensis]